MSLGDELLSKALEDEEDLNMDLIWDITDHYKNACILAGKKEVSFTA